MSYENEMTLKFKSLSENESFARVCVASFVSILNPSIEQIADIKTAVSEAVTNCVVHAYPNKIGEIVINAKIKGQTLYISIIDFGVGIKDIERAKEAFYTTKPDSERSGMGFTVMESFMDEMSVKSKLGQGTEVILVKRLERLKAVIGG